MKRRACFFALALTFSAAAQNFEPHLWRISSSANTVYLFGSIHVGTPDMYPLPKTVEEAFVASSVLLLEVYETASDVRPPAAGDSMRERMLYPDGDSLWKHVSRGTRRRIEAACQRDDMRRTFREMELELDDLPHFRPWLVALLLNIKPAMSQGLQPELGIDDHFRAEAESARKRIAGIETGDFQSHLASNLPEKLQVKWLESELGMRRNVADVQEALVSSRNAHMADAAEEFLRTGPQIFMVVGGSHVAGILDLLKSRGYKVEEVPLAKRPAGSRLDPGRPSAAVPRVLRPLAPGGPERDGRLDAAAGDVLSIYLRLQYKAQSDLCIRYFGAVVERNTNHERRLS
jgi:uncharacterized protein YbaP (TraB family)